MLRFVRPSGSPKAIGEYTTMTTRATVAVGTLAEITDRAGETINVAKVVKVEQKENMLNIEMVMLA